MCVCGCACVILFLIRCRYNWIILCTGLDMVVRDESGNVLDVNSTSTTQLYEHHINAVDRIKKANVSLIIESDDNIQDYGCIQ